jgi:hypothetical protein
MTTAAERAVEHILQRILSDPRVAYYFDPLTESMELLSQAHAEIHGLDAADFRRELLSNFRAEVPARSRDANPVSDIAREMAQDAEDLIALIDKQTYDEYRRGDWDLPDDCELLVTFTAKDLQKLDRILNSYAKAATTAAKLAHGPV